MKVLQHPIVGIFLNLLYYGLADIVTGNISYGIAKVFLQTTVLPMLVILIQGLDERIRAKFYFAFLIFYIVYLVWIAVDGYRTFSKKFK